MWEIVFCDGWLLFHSTQRLSGCSFNRSLSVLFSETIDVVDSSQDLCDPVDNQDKDSSMQR